MYCFNVPMHSYIDVSFYFHLYLVYSHGHNPDIENNPTIPITFKLKDGTLKIVDAKIGDNLLNVAHKNSIDMEGACGGVTACSTCHVILTDNLYDKLEEASEDEEDMLDSAFALTCTSRLGCQVIVTKDMIDEPISLPVATRNFYVDGHVPQPH